MFQIFLSLPKKIILYLLRLYQKTLSLDHGPFRFLRPYGACKFHPSCSNYSYESINKFGLLKGLFFSAKRLARCHPWSSGGYDPVK